MFVHQEELDIILTVLFTAVFGMILVWDGDHEQTRVFLRLTTQGPGRVFITMFPIKIGLGRIIAIDEGFFLFILKKYGWELFLKNHLPNRFGSHLSKVR